MPQKSRAGRSAYGAAMMKAIEGFTPDDQRLFDDPVVLDLLPAPMRFAIRRHWLRERFGAMLDRAAPGIRGALLCRTRCIDDWVLDALRRGLRSVVTLGAGLDTRPYRLAEMAHAAVFEVDLPAVQDFKKARLTRRFGALPAHVRFVPSDFNAERIDVILGRAGLSEQEPAIFVCEGVTQYLQPAAVDDLFRIIAARPEGTEVVFTYVLEEVVTGRFRADRTQAFRKSAARRPEPWLFGVEPSRLGAFLRERKLTLREDVGAEEHLHRYVRSPGRTMLVSDIERVARASVGPFRSSVAGSM
jgi:methyltransferase (TIGR00027 family)